LRESSLNFEFVVLGIACPGDGSVRQVCAHYFGVDLIRVDREFLQYDGDAVDFLSRRAGGTPDTDRLGKRSGRLRCSPVDEIGENLASQEFKRGGIAKKLGLVGGNGIDDFSLNGSGSVRFEFKKEFTVRGTVKLFGDPSEPGFYQIGLALIKGDTRYVPYLPGDIPDLSRVYS
jgi:hypothetical protein